MNARQTANFRATAFLLTSFIAVFILTGARTAAAVSAEDAKVGVVECTPQLIKKHNPGLAADNSGKIICFEGFISDFNVTPRKVGKKTQYLGVPHWVAHNVKRVTHAPESGDRPSQWFTIAELAKKRIAPTHQSYQFSKEFNKTHKNWYDRGHLAQKYLVERLGQKAALYTHNVVNAVPQRSQFNQRPWLWLECMTGAWANRYSEVWVIAGPVFKKNKRITWLRSDSNKKAMPVAIPAAIFKIVLRKDGDRWDVLSFVYPQTHKTYAKSPYDPEIWFKSVADIEKLTGETFLTGLPDAESLKQKMPEKLWPVSRSDYDLPACQQQQTDIN